MTEEEIAARVKAAVDRKRYKQPAGPPSAPVAPSASFASLDTQVAAPAQPEAPPARQSMFSLRPGLKPLPQEGPNVIDMAKQGVDVLRGLGPGVVAGGARGVAHIGRVLGGYRDLPIETPMEKAARNIETAGLESRFGQGAAETPEGAARRQQAYYRGGQGVGETVGGFATAPFAIPLQMGAAVLRDIANRGVNAGESEVTKEAKGLWEGIYPGAAYNAAVAEIESQTDLTPHERAAAKEQFIREHGAGVVAGVAGLIDLAGGIVSGIRARRAGGMPEAGEPVGGPGPKDIPGATPAQESAAIGEVNRQVDELPDLPSAYQEHLTQKYPPEGIFIIKRPDGSIGLASSHEAMLNEEREGGSTLKAFPEGAGDINAMDAAAKEMASLSEVEGHPETIARNEVAGRIGQVGEALHQAMSDTGILGERGWRLRMKALLQREGIEHPATETILDDTWRTLQREPRGPRVLEEEKRGYKPEGRELSKLGFYSNTLEALKGWQPRGTPEQLAAHLLKTRGAAEEAKWIGLDGFLKDKKTVTRQEVEDFVRQNQVEVEEVARGAKGSREDPELEDLQANAIAAEEDAREAKEDYESGLEDLRLLMSERGHEVLWDYADEIVRNTGAGRYGGLIGRAMLDPDIARKVEELEPLAQAHTEAQDAHVEAQNALSDYESQYDEPELPYEQYTLPGGKDYREFLLKTKPRQVGDVAPAEIDTSGWRVIDETEPNAAGQRDVTIVDADDNVVFHRYNTLATNEEVINDHVATLRESTRSAGNYAAPHFGGGETSRNIVAHVRTTDRVDTHGDEVLFIEELQSDWAQAGKKEGFLDEDRADMLQALITDSLNKRRALDAYIRETRKKFPEMRLPATDSASQVLWRMAQAAESVSRDSPLREAADKIEGLYNVWMEASEKRRKMESATGIPTAPFVMRTKDWLSLAIKRMLRFAAENGYDRIAWTTGEQQVKRYANALQSHIDELQWDKMDDGGIQIRGFKDERRVITKVFPAHELDDAIGARMAGQIRSNPATSGVISGSDITVSDTGMAGFYDRIVPQAVAQIVKEWGGKVEHTVIRHGRGVDTRTSAQQSVEITAKMKDAVLTRGQALFEPETRYTASQDAHTAEKIYEDADVRPGTTSEQKELGTHALRALFDFDRRAGATLLGLALRKDFIERKGSELIGKVARNPKELALLAQILRDDRYETLRFFFTKGKEIVGHTAYSSRLPGSVVFGVPKMALTLLRAGGLARRRIAETIIAKEQANQFRVIRDAMSAHEADGYYLMHNHPSGRAVPSPQDLGMTAEVAKKIGGFKGHIVIDHEKYGLIRILDTGPVQSTHTIPVESRAEAGTPMLPHEALDMPIFSAADLVKVAKTLETTEGKVILVGTASDGSVQAIAEFPRELLTKARGRAVVRIQRFARKTGVGTRANEGLGVFAVLSRGDNIEAYDGLIKSGMLADVLTANGESRRAYGVSPENVQPRYAPSVRVEAPGERYEPGELPETTAPTRLLPKEEAAKYIEWAKDGSAESSEIGRVVVGAYLRQIHDNFDAWRSSFLKAVGDEADEHSRRIWSDSGEYLGALKARESSGSSFTASMGFDPIAALRAARDLVHDLRGKRQGEANEKDAQLYMIAQRIYDRLKDDPERKAVEGWDTDKAAAGVKAIWKRRMGRVLTPPEQVALDALEDIYASGHAEQPGAPTIPMGPVRRIFTGLRTKLYGEHIMSGEADRYLQKAYKMTPLRPRYDKVLEQQAGAASMAEAAVHEFRRDVLAPLRAATSMGEITAIAKGPYQASMDRLLDMMVESGRMSADLKAKIRESNDFYAPFRVMKHLEEREIAANTGRPIPGTADLTKAITGIHHEDFGLADLFKSSEAQIVRAVILAQKNKKMLWLGDMAKADTRGDILRKLEPGMEKRRGYEIVTYLENGEPLQMEVVPELAKSLKGLSPGETNQAAKIALMLQAPLRFGTITANLGFQAANIITDQASAMLISKYGLGATNKPGLIRTPAAFVRDVAMWPIEAVSALYSSSTEAAGHPNETVLRWMKSGAMSSTLSAWLREEMALHPPTKGPFLKTRKATRGVLDSIGAISQALDQMTKGMMLGRGMRIEGIDKITDPWMRERKMMEVVAEIRRYGGTPDAMRQGEYVKGLSLLKALFMFLPVRLQGAARDLSRLTFMPEAGGWKAALPAHLRLAGTIGAGAVYLYHLNHLPENKDDYDAVSQWEKDNYAMFPQYDDDGKPLYFVNEEGQKVREYFKLPVKETLKLYKNLIESAMTFTRENEPGKFRDAMVRNLDDLSPVGAMGPGGGLSPFAPVKSLHPWLKVAAEEYMGRSTFTGRDIVPEGLQNLDAEEQYTSRTHKIYIAAAKPLSKLDRALGGKGVSPMQIQHVVEGMLGTLPRTAVSPEPLPGRSTWSENVVGRRFWRSTQVNLQPLYDAFGPGERAYNTVRKMVKDGRVDEARAYAADHEEDLVAYFVLKPVRDAISKQKKAARLGPKRGSPAEPIEPGLQYGPLVRNAIEAIKKRHEQKRAQ